MTNKKNETPTAQAAATTSKKVVWLTNKTQRPIHIMQRGKDEDGNNLENIRLSTMGAVAVAPETLNLGGVKQLLANKSVKEVSEVEAKRLNKALDAVISQADDDEEDNEED